MTYTKTLEQYQTLYSASRRTIQRWKKKGWPLDDETATRALIDEHGKSRENGEAGNELTPWVEGTGAIGLKASIERLQKKERDAHASYEAALKAGDTDGANVWRRQWLEFAEQLRKIEKDTPQVTEANRQSVSLSDLSATLGELFQKLRSDLEAMPPRLARLVAGCDEIGAREKLEAEVNTIVTNLYDCKYLRDEGEEG